MEVYITIIIGIIVGILGFYFSKFWMQPILLYRETKSKIIGKLIYFSDVYEDDNFVYLKHKSQDEPEMKEVYNNEKTRMNEKKLEYRKLSGELMGIIMYLPLWYKLIFLKTRDENPFKAKDELIGLSNSISYEDDKIRKYNIQVLLKVPGWEKLKKPNISF